MMRYVFFGLSVSVSLAFSLSLSLCPAYSQTSPLETDEPYQSSERDTFSSGLGEGISPFDLIHGINASQGMSIEEYRNQQQENLDSAASQFRQQQRQLLQQESSNPSQPTPLSK